MVAAVGTTLGPVNAHVLLTCALVLAAAYVLLVAGLMLAGRGGQARAGARFVPDCVVVFWRLMRDPRIPRRRRAALLLAALYLLTPLDVVPDFIPVAGQLDDAIVVLLALRYLLRGTDRQLLDEHWPGPAPSLTALKRLAFETA